MARGPHWPGSNFELGHYRRTGSSFDARRSSSMAAARGLHWPGSNFKLRHYRLTGSLMPADPHPWRPFERSQHIRNSRAGGTGSNRRCAPRSGKGCRTPGTRSRMYERRRGSLYWPKPRLSFKLRLAPGPRPVSIHFKRGSANEMPHHSHGCCDALLCEFGLFSGEIWD